MADNGVEELLARAILDLELKMKHEIRQNSSFLLAKIEHHYLQVDKRLANIEAKVDALNLGLDGRQQGGRGGRTSSYAPMNNRLREYGGGRQFVGGGGSLFMPTHSRNGRPPSERSSVSQQAGAVPHSPMSGQQQQHPYKMFGAGGAGGTPVSRNLKPPKFEKPLSGGHGHGGRYKQTLGTNKAQVQHTLPPLQNQWTAKATGVYTEDEDSGDEVTSGSEGSDFKNSAKNSDKEDLEPAQQNGLNGEHQQQKGESVADEDEPTVLDMRDNDAMAIYKTIVGGETVFVGKFGAISNETLKPKQMHSSNVESSSSEMVTMDVKSEESAAVFAAMMNIKENHPPMSIVTPGATISPVIGGFGRSRRTN